MAIITVSREMGTGAYQITREVAKKLKYTLIDGPKIAELAPLYGLTPEMVERVDEKPPVFLSAEDRVHAACLGTIDLIMLDCVKKGNAILYGRGAQDLLKEMRNVLRIRFTAPFDERVENFAEREWMDPDLARELIRKSDHQRGGFIQFYFDRDWTDSLGYDLVFNTSRLSVGAIVDSIVAAARDPRLKEAEAEANSFLDDVILAKRIETELLKADNIETSHFRISARGGEVFLAGHVHSELEKEKAMTIIAGIEGVVEIEDTVQVISYKPYKK
ncbi:cytidylate kinase family protein [Geobacter sp. DSM 9736]|uniref:cytidylate kinase family protein n=1 Tax=Geobacter sp. DSM 9736 TaxID=1277350 RepID=UPI000B4FFE08|nr:cytidylate kinase family protein [Geobacter sp. DSM 9736]SNB45726.1 Cytidylate kinase [Geobacter sp. DSM 9736]